MSRPRGEACVELNLARILPSGVSGQLHAENGEGFVRRSFHISALLWISQAMGKRRCKA